MAHRTLVVGLGHRGRQWITELSAAGWPVVGGVDPSPRAREGAGGALASVQGHVFEHLDEALDITRPEAVVVASSADQHLDAVLTCVGHCRGVLVEKPMTTTLAEAHRLVDAADAAGTPVMVGQNYRYMRSNRTVRSVIDAGALGDVGFVDARYYRTPHEMAPSLAASSDSALWGMAVHHLDALRYLLRAEASSVAAERFTLPWTDLPPGASLQAMLEFEGGTRINYSASYESRGHEYFGGGQEFYERVVGSKATLHVFHRWLFLCEGRKLPRPIRRGKRAMTEEAVLLKQLSDAIEHGTEPECSARDNLGTIAILEACTRSASELRRIEIQELLTA